MTKRRKGSPERMNPFIDDVLRDVGVQPASVPTMTPEQIAESRRLLLATAPPPDKVMPPGVPERYVDVRFATTRPRPEVKGFARAAKAAHHWADQVAAGAGSLLALVGDTGTSKSHLAACAAWHLHDEYNLRAPYYSWYKLVEWLRSGRTEETEHGTRELTPGLVRQRWYDTRFCIVDEVRPTSATDFDAMELAKFSMQRYDDRRGVLLTGNWADLGELIGKPAADRYTIITLDGPSYREKGGRK